MVMKLAVRVRLLPILFAYLVSFLHMHMFHITSVNIYLTGTCQTLGPDKGQCQLELQNNIFLS